MSKEKQVTWADFIGITLERVYCTSADVPKNAANKSVVLCFSNGKSVHFDAEICLDRGGVIPVVRTRDGNWELIKKVEEYTDEVGYQPDEESNSVGKNFPEDKDTL